MLSFSNRLYETFDEGNDFYIVTELVEGGELFDRIVSKSHYTEKGARDLVKLMLETIDYVHQSGYVHRDLKPENLLLMSGKCNILTFKPISYKNAGTSLIIIHLLLSEKDDSSIKIADFGFAKRIDELAAKETACGTPGYVAPGKLT